MASKRDQTSSLKCLQEGVTMNNRKDEHVKLALKHHGKETKSDFDDLRFVYDALPKIDVSDVSLETNIENIVLESPFYINAMTGGSEKTKLINEKLAEVAKATNIAMASGSLSAALKDEKQNASFRVIRDVNKEGLVFANIGAEYTLKEAQQAIKILDADVLQIHINIIQELVMPEGDRTFKHWSDNIKEIVEGVNVPVIVKEVGSGMSESTISRLVELGVKNIDVSGKGGTNFALIENDRRQKQEYDYLINFGQSTVISLLEANKHSNVNILASGGIRNPLDIVKCLSLGANAVGVSGLILNSVMNEGVEETIKLVESYKHELKVIMTILGCSTISELRNIPIVITNDVRDWMLARDMDYTQYAKR